MVAIFLFVLIHVLGKDKVIFVNKDDYRQPIDSQLAKVDEEEEEGG